MVRLAQVKAWWARINCWYKDQVIGVGPGKMKHAERKLEWEAWENAVQHDAVPEGPLVTGKGRVLQVEYKKDPSYEALREPTFQCWRPDKSEESYE